MARVLFLFMDGVGLGADDPSRNPMTVAPACQRYRACWAGSR